MKYTFLKPYKFESETFNEVELNEDLTAKDYTVAEREFKEANPGYSGVLELEGGWYTHLLARAASKPVEFFEYMPISDFVRLKGQMSNFLAGLTSGN